MASELKSKPCETCGELADIRYRIQFDSSRQWQLVCPDCWEQLSQNTASYRYGGTWKAR